MNNIDWQRFFEKIRKEEENRIKHRQEEIEKGCDKCSQWDDYYGCRKCESLM